ncbi:MAG: TetR/AcrR family transcriptional regulator [Streptosporangiaceae bacterium]
MVSKTRDALLAAAAQLLDEGGPEAVTLREVGHRTGVSHNAPYKHFADKEALLAAVAARELDRRSSALSATVAGLRPPGAAVQAVMRGYVAWALEFPQRFKLVYGSWSKGSDELAAAAGSARALFTGVVTAAQQAGQLPAGDPERLASLLLALAHGAVDLALAGHLSPTGKGRATPAELADDLLGYLRAAAQPETG